MKCLNDGDWMPYGGCLSVAAFVRMVCCLANSLLLKFVSLRIGFNYLCTNLEIGSLALSKWKPFYSSIGKH